MYIKLKSLVKEYHPYTKPYRSVSISDDVAIDKLKTNHSEAVRQYRNGNIIYRGKADRESLLFIQPSLHYRASRNTGNFYTALIDVLPSWKAWPKRSKSLIATSSIKVADIYGIYGRRYIVFPENNAKLGRTTDTGDFWYSFKYMEKRLQTSTLPTFNDLFANLFDKFDIDIRDVNETNILQKLHEADAKITKNAIPPSDIKNDIAQHYNTSWLEYFDDLLNPDKNNLKLQTIETYDAKNGGNVRDESEVWTDADSIMVEYNYIDNILSKV